MGLAIAKALVYQFEMLEFLIVQPEQEGGHTPVIVAERTPVLNGESGERFAEVTLQCDAMQERKVVRGGIGGWICEG